jgi:hypothetical protein
VNEQELKSTPNNLYGLTNKRPAFVNSLADSEEFLFGEHDLTNYEQWHLDGRVTLNLESYNLSKGSEIKPVNISMTTNEVRTTINLKVSTPVFEFGIDWRCARHLTDGNGD